jgi:hypothetical protein
MHTVMHSFLTHHPLITSYKLTIELITIMLVIALLFFLAFAGAASNTFKKSHRASCNRKQLCNGNLMCAFVCEKGSVEVDQWVRSIEHSRLNELY